MELRWFPTTRDWKRRLDLAHVGLALAHRRGAGVVFTSRNGGRADTFQHSSFEQSKPRPC